MDQTLVSYYAQKFAACDREELGDLVARRADFSDEAAAGLDQALSAKGLRETDVYTPPQAPFDGYVYLVPFVEGVDHFFLKTVIPSRTATRDYLQQGESNGKR